MDNIFLAAKYRDNAIKNDYEPCYIVKIIERNKRIYFYVFKHWDSALIFVLTNYVIPIERTIIHKDGKKLKYRIEKQDHYQDYRTYKFYEPEEKEDYKWRFMIRIFPAEYYADYDYELKEFPRR